VKCDTLKARADEILAGYQVSHSVDDLEIVIGLYEETLRLRPAGHERQAEAFNDLGVALYYFCFHQKVDEARANRAIELLREGLRLRPRGHPLRHRSLHDLARTLNLIQYEQLGGTIDIVEESAALNREALQLRPPGHPERLNSLGGLANDLGRIFQHTGDVDIQAKTVRIRREALEICPPDHPLRYMALDTLGGELKGSFEITGDSETLAEAIVLTREAIQMCPMEHPERWMVLDNLSHLLWFRFAYQGHSYSLPEAIDLSREALQLLSEAHPKRPTIMGNLADLLLTRFRHHGDGNALTEPITLLREALDMRTSGSCSDDHALQCLADALELKYDDDGDLASLLEAATLRRDTLLLRPIGNWRRHVSLEGLAQVLNKIGDESWPEALSCYLEALQVCPVGCPDRARLLSGLSRCYLNPTSQYFNFSEGITCLSKAYANSISPVSGRLKSAIVDLQQLEAAYGASMKGGHAKPRPYEDERVLNLYTQVMGLLPLAANFGLDHSARLQALTGCDEISRNAAARAMLLGGVSQAVQMLEQGRGVFWTQTLHLRATAFDRVPRDDCQELQRMLRLFEHGVRRVESLKQSVIQHERELEERRQLNESVQALILKIRGYPGLDRFLLPPVFGSLLSSLPDGYVVIVNVSKLGHHAFLLRRSTGLATGLELKPFRAGFDCATLRTRLPREGALHARAMRINKGTVSKFEEVLSVVWTSIVHPVLQALGLHVSRGSLSHALCLI
jgi:tetratricopeptide (TPR) repeat protein